jgi:hypothetical protein
VRNPTVLGEAIPFGGPKALSQLDAVTLAEKASGKSLRREFMSIEQIAAARQTVSDSLTASFLGLFEALARGDELPDRWANRLGITPKSMEEWFSDSFR